VSDASPESDCGDSARILQHKRLSTRLGRYCTQSRRVSQTHCRYAKSPSQRTTAIRSDLFRASIPYGRTFSRPCVWRPRGRTISRGDSSLAAVRSTRSWFLREKRRIQGFADQRRMDYSLLDLGIAMAHFSIACKADGVKGNGSYWGIIPLKSGRNCRFPKSIESSRCGDEARFASAASSRDEVVSRHVSSRLNSPSIALRQSQPRSRTRARPQIASGAAETPPKTRPRWRNPSRKLLTLLDPRRRRLDTDRVAVDDADHSCGEHRRKIRVPPTRQVRGR